MTNTDTSSQADVMTKEYKVKNVATLAWGAGMGLVATIVMFSIMVLTGNRLAQDESTYAFDVFLTAFTFVIGVLFGAYFIWCLRLTVRRLAEYLIPDDPKESSEDE